VYVVCKQKEWLGNMLFLFGSYFIMLCHITLLSEHSEHVFSAKVLLLYVVVKFLCCVTFLEIIFQAVFKF
jgi:hypothetical protein